MRQHKCTYNLDTSRQGWVEYSEHGGRTKHLLARGKETHGGLSKWNMQGGPKAHTFKRQAQKCLRMVTTNEGGQKHIHSGDEETKGGLSTAIMDEGE